MSAPSEVGPKARPKVGVAVFIISENHPGCVLLGKRKGSAPGREQYATPGGHLEFGESWEACAARETIEETGLQLKNIQFKTVLNAVEVDNNYHYIDLFMCGEVDLDYKKEPENLEPHKCEGWYWFKWTEFPPLEDLFCGLRLLREQGYDLFKT